MAWRSYHYVLGVVLLVPTALVVTMLWAWRRLRTSGAAMLEAGPTRQLRQPGVSEEFSIPAESVGYVIGRRGQRVRDLEKETGARIRFKDQQDSEDKIVVISGSAEAVERAGEQVKENVKRIEEREAAVSVGVLVPSYAIGRLIGRKGANIRAIQRESGASVTVPSGGEQDIVECEVIGDVVEIDRAVALIQESIQQSELLRRRKAVHSRQKTRKPATTPPEEELPLVSSVLPPTADFFPVFVSAVSGDGTVWLQLVEGSDPANLDSLVDNMTNDYSKLGPEEMRVSEEDLVVEEGLVVAAPFPHDQNWYRARVMGVANSTLELLFLDFGDIASVDVAMVKTLRPNYRRLPIQAIPVHLSRINPKGGSWSDKAIELLDSLTLCASWKVVMVMVEVRGQEKSGVKIVDTTTEKDIDVAEQLVDEDVAEWSMERPMGDGEDSKVPVTLEWVDGRSVSVAGSFSNWEPVPLSRTDLGIYQGSISLPSEGSFEYKFVVDGKWTYNPSQPTVDDGYGGFNNVLNTRTLSLEWGNSREVCVAGTFSNWQPVPMKKQDTGSYSSTLELPLESSFEYKFVVDGEWQHNNDMPKVNDPFGGHNNILNISGSPPPN